MKKSKDAKHKDKMLERRINNARKDMCKETLRLVLLDIYLILAETYGFGNEELKTFNGKIYNNVLLHKETPNRAKVNKEQVIELLINKYNREPDIVYGLIGE